MRLVAAAVLLVACDPGASTGRVARAEVASAPRADVDATTPPAPPLPAATEDRFTHPRKLMVDRQLAGRDIVDRRVLRAMGKVPRHRFVPAHLMSQAYADYPLPIGHEQTISQPYVVAFMSQALQLEGDERVLEIGTGSGYQAAVLGELAREVYTIEIVPPLAERAGALLTELGYDRVHVRAGDGYRGWPEHAPFEAIMVTAAPDHVPEPLIEQLAPGGRMIIPVGAVAQDLLLIERTPSGVTRRRVLPVRFVPMTGESERRR